MQRRQAKKIIARACLPHSAYSRTQILAAFAAMRLPLPENIFAERDARKNESARQLDGANSLQKATRRDKPDLPLQNLVDIKHDYGMMTVSELRNLAKARSLTGYSSMKKADLIAALTSNP